jgi:hypothetical protein
MENIKILLLFSLTNTLNYSMENNENLDSFNKNNKYQKSLLKEEEKNKTLSIELEEDELEADRNYMLKILLHPKQEEIIEKEHEKLNKRMAILFEVLETKENKKSKPKVKTLTKEEKDLKEKLNNKKETFRIQLARIKEDFKKELENFNIGSKYCEKKEYVFKTLIDFNKKKYVFKISLKENKITQEKKINQEEIKNLKIKWDIELENSQTEEKLEIPLIQLEKAKEDFEKELENFNIESKFFNKEEYVLENSLKKKHTEENKIETNKTEENKIETNKQLAIFEKQITTKIALEGFKKLENILEIVFKKKQEGIIKEETIKIKEETEKLKKKLEEKLKKDEGLKNLFDKIHENFKKKLEDFQTTKEDSNNLFKISEDDFEEKLKEFKEKDKDFKEKLKNSIDEEHERLKQELNVIFWKYHDKSYKELKKILEKNPE